MGPLTWTSKTLPIEKLIPADYNPRKLSRESESQLDTSIKKFSLADPIVINADNKIIGGHQRLKILNKAGFKTVDVRVPSRLLSDTEEKELNLRLNKNLGEWDFDALAKFDEDMLKDVGFNPDELDHIFKVETAPEADDVPDARPTTDIKPGDLFQLGDHRLLCGDSTKADDVARLMAGEKADMVFTDPPYGVNYTGKAERLGRKGSSQIQGDEDVESASRIYEAVFINIASILSDGGVYYICAPQGGDQEMMMMMMRSTIPCRHQLIWKKDSPVFSMGRLDYDYQHEPMLYGWKGSHKHLRGGKQKTSVWEIPRPKASKLHPTMKPVELVEEAILNSAERDSIVIDFFGGSGSTLIACEQTSRKCRMIEIDPIYCQVIIDRWEGISGKTAKRI